MNKTQIWAEAQKHMKASKVKEDAALYLRMAELLAPKTKSSLADVNPAIYGEDGEIAQLWCSKHEQYEDTIEFSKSPKFKRLYDPNCKVAVKQWRAIQKGIKELKEEQDMIKDSVLTGAYSIEDAKAEIAEIQSKIDAETMVSRGTYEYPKVEDIDPIEESGE